MDTFLLRNLSELLRTGIFYVEQDGLDDSWKTMESNPLCCDGSLRSLLAEAAGDRLKRHRFCKHYHILEHAEKNLRRFTLMEVLQTMCIVAKIVTGREYSDQELVDANRMAMVTKEQEVKDRIRFNLQSEEEDIFRHSYQEEREILDMVREGNVEEAVRLTKKIDVEIGRMGRSELTHLRNLLTVGASLCARAAIEGGVSPYAAYRVSGFYINKGAECRDTVQDFQKRSRHLFSGLCESGAGGAGGKPAYLFRGAHPQNRGVCKFPFPELFWKDIQVI